MMSTKYVQGWPAKKKPRTTDAPAPDMAEIERLLKNLVDHVYARGLDWDKPRDGSFAEQQQLCRALLSAIRKQGDAQPATLPSTDGVKGPEHG